MSLLAVSNFLAILSLLALAASLAIIALRLVSGVGGAGELLGGLRAAIGPYAMWLAWLVALTATAGSLYFSEVAGLVPCALCWYQRIAMYPLAAILLLAALRSDAVAIRPYATVLAVVGAIVAAYHVALQRLPFLPSASCSLEAPCTAVQIERFGFVTIPVMALIGFVTILVLLWLLAEPLREETET